MKCKKKKLIIYLFFLSLSLLLVLPVSKFVYSQVSSIIDATVKISICGNAVIEGGEDCEGLDLNGYTCESLGYSSGNLTCDIACSFDTTSCTVPTIDPSNVTPDDVDSLLAAGYFTIPPTASIISTPSLTTTDQIIVYIPTIGGTDSVILPSGLVITKTGNNNFDPTSLACADVLPNSLSGFSSGLIVDGALQWGISGVSLELSDPVTLSIFVGSFLDGQTLGIIRSNSLNSGWTTDGIIAPATCIVSEGLCTFQTTKASYFATTRPVIPTPTPTPTPSPTPLPTPTPTPGSSSSGSSSPTATPTPTTVPSPMPILMSFLPFPVSFFDINKNGIIDQTEVFATIKTWVSIWKEEKKKRACYNIKSIRWRKM